MRDGAVVVTQTFRGLLEVAAVLGGLLPGLVNAVVGRYVSSSYQTVISFAILLALLAMRPHGLIGSDWEESH